MLKILLRQNLNSVQLSLNQWQYKLLPKLDDWSLKHQLDCGSLNGERPFPNPSLVSLACIGSARRQEVQELKF